MSYVVRVTSALLVTAVVWVSGFSVAVAQTKAPAEAQLKSVAKLSTPFFDLVKRNFRAWDLDKNGELDQKEIELAVHNPAVKEDVAAAAASLRRGSRAVKGFAPANLEKIAVSLQTKSTEEVEQPKFESMFESHMEKLPKLQRELFTEGSPRIDVISQGRLGDCFLIASLGTCAYKDPQRLVSMMKPLENGKVLVTYGSGVTKELDAPTDAELLIGATSRGTGAWTVMYEKAIGTVMLANSKTGKHATPLSLIGVGGTPNVPLQILTGHFVRRHGCEQYRDVKNDDGSSAMDLQPLRDDLKAAFAEGRLVVGGCGPKGKQAIVSGIYYNHSYGVLDYDEKTDTVLFWNPFGNTRTPKGPDGLEHGYTTEHGRFRVPLKEAVMWFGSFSIETTEKTDLI